MPKKSGKARKSEVELDEKLEEVLARGQALVDDAVSFGSSLISLATGTEIKELLSKTFATVEQRAENYKELMREKTEDKSVEFKQTIGVFAKAVAREVLRSRNNGQRKDL